MTGRRDEATGRVRRLLPLLHSADVRVVSAASGGSMGERFAAGAAIEIETGAGRTLAVGDVVAVARGDGIVAHRLVHVGSGRRAGHFITKGDNRRLPDRLVHRTAIVGRVTALEVDGAWIPVPGAPPAFDRGLSVRTLRFIFDRHLPAAALWASATQWLAAVASKLRRRLPPRRDQAG